MDIARAADQMVFRVTISRTELDILRTEYAKYEEDEPGSEYVTTMELARQLLRSTER